MTNITPAFECPINQVVEHYNPSISAPCYLQSLENYELNQQDIDRIVKICNEPAVKELFPFLKIEGSSELKEYTRDNAVSFLKWAISGWLQLSHFVFLIRNQENQIVGAIDIKSNNLDEAEIGYWMTKDSPGYMTQAVLQLIKIAKQVGYKSLFGLVKPENVKSRNVLKRAGFIEDGMGETKGLVCIKLSKDL